MVDAGHGRCWPRSILVKVDAGQGQWQSGSMSIIVDAGPVDAIQGRY